MDYNNLNDKELIITYKHISDFIKEIEDLEKKESE